MNALLDVALGPVLRATALFLVLGLLREAILRIAPGLAAGVSVSSRGTVAVSTRPPIRLERAAGWLVVPAVLLLAFARDHVILIGSVIPETAPLLEPAPAEWIAVLVLVGLVGALLVRARRRRGTSARMPLVDIALGLLAATLAFGLLARHPQLSPLPYRAALLVHVLAAEAFFVSIPIALARRREVTP